MNNPFPQESLSVGHKSRLSFYNRLLYEFSVYLEGQIERRLKGIGFVIDEPLWVRSQRKDLRATSNVVNRLGERASLDRNGD